jgi:hypothetical protein
MTLSLLTPAAKGWLTAFRVLINCEHDRMANRLYSRKLAGCNCLVLLGFMLPAAVIQVMSPAIMVWSGNTGSWKVLPWNARQLRTSFSAARVAPSAARLAHIGWLMQVR